MKLWLISSSLYNLKVPANSRQKWVFKKSFWVHSCFRKLSISIKVVYLLIVNYSSVFKFNIHVHTFFHSDIHLFNRYWLSIYLRCYIGDTRIRRVFRLEQWFSTVVLNSNNPLYRGSWKFRGVFCGNWGKLVVPGGGQGCYMTCYSQDRLAQWRMISYPPNFLMAWTFVWVETLFIIIQA